MLTKDQPRLGAVPAWSPHAERRDTPFTYLLLAGILLLAAVLRFWSLTARGFIYWDEGKFALEGMRLHWALGHLLGSKATLTGKPVGTAKPTHALLMALGYTVMGVHDYAPLVIDAAASLLSVALLFFVARRLFDPTVGLLAALLLAVSEYDVIYARSALSESDANLFLLAGVLCWVHSYGDENRALRRPAWLWPLLAGLLMGVGFTANYRLLVYIAAIVAFDLWWCARQAGWRWSAIRALLWATGLCLAPVLWQLAGLLGDSSGVVLFQGDVAEISTTYLREAMYQLHEGKQSVLRFQPLPYLQWYVVRESWPLFLLTLLGMVMALRQRRFAWLAMTVPVLLPYLVYVFAPFVVPRNLTSLLPFASVLAAAAVVEPARRLKHGGVRLAALLLAALLFGGYEGLASWRLSGVRSGFAQAAQYVDRRGGGALTSNEIMVFYLRGHGMLCTAPAFPQHVAFLPQYSRWGYAYIVLDNHHTSRGTLFVRAHLPRVARYPAAGAVSLGESLISSENGSAPDPHAQPEHVDVYRFGRSHGAPLKNRANICSVDEVT